MKSVFLFIIWLIINPSVFGQTVPHLQHIGVFRSDQESGVSRESGNMNNTDKILTSKIYIPNISNANTIWGVINIYTPVKKIEMACNTLIHVKNSDGFSIGDKVLIIQMQGTLVDETNTYMYGKPIDYRNAGNHEFSRIRSINGQIISLENRLLHNYLIAGKIQLVRVPEYADVEIIGELTCKQWDGETGGILVFESKSTITMGTNINVNGKGFRGAKAISSPNFPGYFEASYKIMESSPGYGAAKGEGIAENGTIPYTNGKGAPANGGGGGNNHNAGGGGGGNVGKGGNGGYGWNKGNYIGDYKTAQGIGGYNIAYNAHRMFLGGGAGAGHTNQETIGDGGNGGGIVIVISKKIVSQGFVIKAEGNNGVSGVEDGAGGGGGGGLIYLDIEEYTNVRCSVKGGNGGNISLPLYSVAPGGGGGGGALLFAAKDLPNGVSIDISGGNAGKSIYQDDFFGSEPGSEGAAYFDRKIHESKDGGDRANQAKLPNVYRKVVQITLNRSGVTLNATEGFCRGDKVLIIQMQGAEILGSDTEDFGKVSTLNTAGNYEFARVEEVFTDKVTFEKPLTRTYDISSKVQLVSVPEYGDFIVDSPLTCQHWDGDIGGVLVFAVKETLFINSNIDVSGKGFRGGKAANSIYHPSHHNSNYVSGVDSTKYSRKGEGIFGWDDKDYRAGRGAAATGGGGGNNHNAGGGGGSNVGCGGNGGFGWTEFQGDRTVTNGLGGLPIITDLNKIFLGGGGGAGHSNEFTGTSGGAGGGIVIIQSNQIISDNKSIISRGEPSENAAFDGVGGGGAGGTILIDCRKFVNTLYLDVRGGSGGSTTEHRDGPGGGGGGGLLCFSAPQSTGNVQVLLKGGGPGTNRDFNTDGATGGCPGSTKYNVLVPGEVAIVSSIYGNEYNSDKCGFIYPNPASNTISFERTLSDSFEILDHLGYKQIVPFTQNERDITVDVSPLSNGSYFLKVGLKAYYFVISH